MPTILPTLPLPLRIANTARRVGARLRKIVGPVQRTAWTPVQALGRLVVAVDDEIRIRRGMWEMESLSDDMLRDIGLDRGGIEGAARRGRERPFPTTASVPTEMPRRLGPDQVAAATLRQPAPDQMAAATLRRRPAAGRFGNAGTGQGRNAELTKRVPTGQGLARGALETRARCGP